MKCILKILLILCPFLFISFPSYARVSKIVGGTVAAPISSFIFLGGGRHATSPALSDFLEYDVETDTYKVLSSLPISLSDFHGLSNECNGFVGLGVTTGGTTFQWFLYNRASNIFTEQGPGTSAADAAQFHLSNGNFYHLTGYASIPTSPNALLELYNTGTGTWTTLSSLPITVRRSAATAFSIGDKGYLGLGQDGGLNFLTDFWRYDGTSWSQIATFPGTGRIGGSGVAVAGKGYIFFGQSAIGNALNDVWEYTPTLNTWDQKAAFPGAARRNSFVINSTNTILIFGGTNVSTGVYFNDVWKYTPSTDSWVQLNNFPLSSRAGMGGYSMECSFG